LTFDPFEKKEPLAMTCDHNQDCGNMKNKQIILERHVWDGKKSFIAQ